jgi:hypothetical protein
LIGDAALQAGVRQQRGDQLLLATVRLLGSNTRRTGASLLDSSRTASSTASTAGLELHLLCAQRLLAELDLGVGQLLDLFQHLLRAGARRQFGDHQLPLAARQVLDLPARAHLQAAAAAAVGVADVGALLMIWPPPGKSGPGQQREQLVVASLSFFSSATVAAATSRRLWLGISVARPTAMPWRR